MCRLPPLMYPGLQILQPEAYREEWLLGNCGCQSAATPLPLPCGRVFNKEGGEGDSKFGMCLEASGPVRLGGAGRRCCAAVAATPRAAAAVALPRLAHGVARPRHIVQPLVAAT